MTKGSVEHARRINRRLVLDLARRNAPIARHNISDVTGLTEAAVSRIARELINAGLLREVGAPRGTSKPGRPSVGMSINPRGAFVFGFDIGANAQSISICDAVGHVVARREVQFPHDTAPEAFFDHVANEARELLRATSSRAGDVAGRLIGGAVAAAGTVAPDACTIVESGNLGWGEVDAAGLLATRLQLPVTVESRPRALALAELRLSQSPDSVDMLVVLGGVGLGSCLVVDGRPLRGHGGDAGQIVHLPVPGANGDCYCGQHHCLDLIASGRAVLKALGRLPEGGVAATAAALEDMLAAADQGDAPAREALGSAGFALGENLQQLVRFAHTQELLLCGPLSRAEAYIEGVANGLSDIDTTVRVSQHDVDTVAAQIALETFLYSDALDLSGLLLAQAS